MRQIRAETCVPRVSRISHQRHEFQWCIRKRSEIFENEVVWLSVVRSSHSLDPGKSRSHNQISLPSTNPCIVECFVHFATSQRRSDETEFPLAQAVTNRNRSFRSPFYFLSFLGKYTHESYVSNAHVCDRRNEIYRARKAITEIIATIIVVIRTCVSSMSPHLR